MNMPVRISLVLRILICVLDPMLVTAMTLLTLFEDSTFTVVLVIVSALVMIAICPGVGMRPVSRLCKIVNLKVAIAALIIIATISNCPQSSISVCLQV
jgi:hypothetical protein